MNESTACENRWDASLYDGRHAFVWKQGAGLVELLAPRSGERILDLGCGTGHLTAQIAAAGAEVVGIDRAAAMIDEARGNYPGLDLRIADARNFSLEQPFDAVFSNAVLHWVQPPEAVVASVQGALKPGGRFVAEFGGRGNVQQIVAALDEASRNVGAGPFQDFWYFPGIAEYADLLEEHGLEVVFATLFDRPTALEGDQGMRNWVAMFANELLTRIAPERREAFLRDIEARLRPTLHREGTWLADYRRLRVVARRIT
jgi:trans-aconitate methyltransferase